MTGWLLAAWLVAFPATPARPVPADVTICVDRAAARCWSAAGRDACEAGEVFAVVPSLDDPDDKLRACWETLRK
jgi:hypothetical protein